MAERFAETCWSEEPDATVREDPTGEADTDSDDEQQVF